jgi:hypothetical protein
VRGTDAIHRVLKLTGVEEMLVLVDDPTTWYRRPSIEHADAPSWLRVDAKGVGLQGV